MRNVNFTDIGLDNHVAVSICATGYQHVSVELTINICSQFEGVNLTASYPTTDGLLGEREYKCAVSMAQAVLAIHCSQIDLQMVLGAIQLFQ